MIVVQWSRLLAERFMDGVADNDGPEIASLRFLSIQAPVIDPRIIEAVVQGHLASIQRPASDAGDSPMRGIPQLTQDAGNWTAVLEKANTRRAFHSEGAYNFEKEPLCQLGTGSGWVARLKKGKPGLAMPED